MPHSPDQTPAPPVDTTGDEETGARPTGRFDRALVRLFGTLYSVPSRADSRDDDSHLLFHLVHAGRDLTWNRLFAWREARLATLLFTIVTIITGMMSALLLRFELSILLTAIGGAYSIAVDRASTVDRRTYRYAEDDDMLDIGLAACGGIGGLPARHHLCLNGTCPCTSRRPVQVFEPLRARYAAWLDAAGLTVDQRAVYDTLVDEYAGTFDELIGTVTELEPDPQATPPRRQVRRTRHLRRRRARRPG